MYVNAVLTHISVVGMSLSMPVTFNNLVAATVIGIAVDVANVL